MKESGTEAQSINQLINQSILSARLVLEATARVVQLVLSAAMDSSQTVNHNHV